MAKRKRALTRIDKLLRSDGALCVTFVNTARRRPIGSYEDLLAWGVEFRALSDESFRRLRDAAAEHPGPAAGAFRKGRALRDRLERMLLALADGGEPEREDFKTFNAELRKAMGARELGPGGQRWSWGEVDGEDFDRMLWPVLYSAARVLTSKVRRRVRRCAREDCGLLFVARSSGRPRKWCGPACLNRSTTRRHYHKTVKPRREQIMRELEGRQRARLAGYDESWEPPESEED